VDFAVLQKGEDAMPSNMSHERQRWSYMTDRQLVTRLNRITGLEKLNNYISVAREIGRDDLSEMGEERREELFPGQGFYPGLLAIKLPENA